MKKAKSEDVSVHKSREGYAGMPTRWRARRQRAAAIGVAQIGSGAAELVKIEEMAMIGTTGSEPTRGTSTNGISAPVP